MSPSQATPDDDDDDDDDDDQMIILLFVVPAGNELGWACNDTGSSH